jgi:NAD(P)H-dependent FMN reductase
MSDLNIFALSLSLRRHSQNAKLLRLAGAVAERAGARFELGNLLEYPVPPYDGDREQGEGIPEGARALHERMSRAAAIILASPEYNFSFPGHFKNTMDWVSRVRPIAWSGKPLFLLSASPALAGGNRGLWQLRVPFEATGCLVYPEMFSLARSHEALTAEGELVEAPSRERLEKMVTGFVDYARKVARPL